MKLKHGGLLWVGILALSLEAAPLPRATPESQGVASAKLLELVEALDREISGMHSLMVMRHGQVVAEGWWAPYVSSRNHVLYSLSKSFASTAVGMAVAEGRLSIDDELLKFFPEHTPAEASSNLKAMRVRDILEMATGHQDEPPTAPDAVSAKSFLNHPVPHLPGTHFKYNTAATFMQSAIVQKLTGQTVLDFLRLRLFEPLGIEQPVWDTNFEGISLGGYGLRLRTEDIAKFGQLYLQRGKWGGKQLLTEDWVALATSKQVSNGSNPKNDWNQGYGFQFWRCRNNAYRGDGAFGQYCVVLPEQDAVVAITSGVRDMQAVLNVLWDKLLPAFESKKLRADRPVQDQLKAKLNRLGLPFPEGAETSLAAAQLLKGTIRFPAGNGQGLESLAIAPGKDGNGLDVAARIFGKPVVIPCGYKKWKPGRAPVPTGTPASFPDEPVASASAWQSENTLEIRMCAVETPFVVTYKLRFEAGQVILDTETNVAFGATKRPRLVGRAD